MEKNFVEIRIRTSVDPGEFLGRIDDAGSLGAYETPDGFCVYWPAGEWNPAHLETIRKALGDLGDLEAGSSVTVSELPDQDWNRRWTESLQPVRLGRRILIRQSWNSADVPPGGFELVIDPKRAFGTGYHATTQLIVEWLEESVRGGERVLDVGTGSGILSMVALRLGARRAVGIDNDPEAIECAREYAAVNGFGPELELRALSLEEFLPEPFDLVVANLDRKTLLGYFPDMHRYVAAGGRVICSGLLAEDCAEISGALATAGWEIHGRKDRDEWMALELRTGAGRVFAQP